MRSNVISVISERRAPNKTEIDAITKEVLGHRPSRLVLSIDGFPGTGKSTIAHEIQRRIQQLGLPVALVSADLDVLPWADRPENSGTMDWTQPDLLREVLENPGAAFDYRAYDVVSHGRTLEIRIQTPKEGVLILEGLRAIERVGEFGGNVENVSIHFQVSQEIAEQLRVQRNIQHGRWKAEEADYRTRNQRPSLQPYYRDLTAALESTSLNVARDVRRLVIE